MDLTSDDVQDILNLLDSLPFGEMHLRTARFSLWLRRTADGQWTQETQILSEPAPGQGAAPDLGAAQEQGAARDQKAAGSAAPPHGMQAVRAPLPGTFYRAPMPGAPPFVDLGSHVEPDTVVAIIETMKLMNSVCAGVRGTIAEIIIADAQFAAQDSALMRVREER